MGPPASTCTVFRSNDLKIRGSLSKVRHPGSVRMVRIIIEMIFSICMPRMTPCLL